MVNPNHVLVTSVPGVKRLSQRLAFPGRWCYLGTSPDEQAWVESWLGRPNRWDGAELFRQVTAELRQPFLDFVADVGAHQEDQLGWWSSRFSWKLWITSDLFLLICYLVMAERLTQEALARGIPLVLVMQDPWLLRQFKENTAGRLEGVRVTPRGTLWPRQVALVAVGLGRRAWWLGKTIRRYWRQRWVWPTGRPRCPVRPTAAIFTVPMPGGLEGPGVWKDAFLPEMDQILREVGYDVVRFAPPDCSGFERELARRHAFVEPLILRATAGVVWRSLLAFWWPRWPRSLAIQGVDVRQLAQREWWLEIGRASWCGFRLFDECFRRMVRRGNWRWIVYPYENQPWEKLIALGASARGVRTAGIQTNVISRYYLAYCLGAGEGQRMPLPDVICTSGPAAHGVFAEGGTPAGRLRMCGSIRYDHLSRLAGQDVPEPSAQSARSKVLVALPIDLRMSRHLLAAVQAAFPTGGREEGLDFLIKPHPMAPLARSAIQFPAEVMPSTFQNLTPILQECALVLFLGSTVGCEALAMGRPALRYRPDLLLDVDEVYGEHLPVCTDASLREMVLTLVRNGRPTLTPESARVALAELFAPFNRESLQAVFRFRDDQETPEPAREAAGAVEPTGQARGSTAVVLRLASSFDSASGLAQDSPERSRGTLAQVDPSTHVGRHPERVPRLGFASLGTSPELVEGRGGPGHPFDSAQGGRPERKSRDGQGRGPSREVDSVRERRK